MWKWIKRVTSGLAGLAILILLSMYLTTEPLAQHPFTDTDDFLVIAHRGGWGHWPGSTMYAFQQAHALGVDALEMDIYATKDGELVVMHDRSVDRTTNGTGMVSDFTLEEIQALDAGYTWSNDDGQTYPFRGQGIIVPTFRSVVEAFPDMRFIVEPKQSEPSIVPEFVDIIREYDAVDRTIIASFNGDTIDEVRSALPAVATFKPSDGIVFTILNMARLSGAFHPVSQAFEIPPRLGSLDIVDKRYMENIHEHNVAVHVWTINEVSEMERLIDVSVDGIITAYPERLLNLLGRLPKDRETSNNKKQIN